MSGDKCTDGRFEMIDRVKKVLIDSTNIETSKEDMAAIDSILFRFWQIEKILHRLCETDLSAS